MRLLRRAVGHAAVSTASVQDPYPKPLGLATERRLT